MWRYRVVNGLCAVALTVAWNMSTITVAQDHGLTPQELERGGQIFLANCANCHGPDADAIASANLATGQFRRAVTDQQLVDVIRNGIPGTAMPPSNIPENQALLLVGYLRALPADVARSTLGGVRGDPVRGATIVETKGKCVDCHRVGGRGGFLGPDLSEIGSIRRSIELERALSEPSHDLRTDNRSVRITFTDGRSTIGRLLNQDTYSLQLIDAMGVLTSVAKAELRGWDILTSSPMPSFSGTLTSQELADVISYLSTLRTPPGRGRGAAPPGGRGGRGVF